MIINMTKETLGAATAEPKYRDIVTTWIIFEVNK